MKIGKLEIIVKYHRNADKIVIDTKQFGIWWYLPLRYGIKHYLKNKYKLKAVKLWKYRTGEGLKESKDNVDKIQEKFYPDYFKQRNNS